MTYQRQRESDEERTLRLRREAVELARARRQAAAGEVLSGPELEAWLDSLGTDLPLSVPEPRTRTRT